MCQNLLPRPWLQRGMMVLTGEDWDGLRTMNQNEGSCFLLQMGLHDDDFAVFCTKIIPIHKMLLPNYEEDISNEFYQG